MKYRKTWKRYTKIWRMQGYSVCNYEDINIVTWKGLEPVKQPMSNVTPKLLTGI